mmetsp:Transcript_106578/g.339383  ORF Transcript_106578/g.339383 Transcript_106578/m.339383 type:complete len:607 (-) Transcript_106578:123-1943(-)
MLLVGREPVRLPRRLVRRQQLQLRRVLGPVARGVLLLGRSHLRPPRLVVRPASLAVRRVQRPVDNAGPDRDAGADDPSSIGAHVPARRRGGEPCLPRGELERQRGQVLHRPLGADARRLQERVPRRVLLRGDRVQSGQRPLRDLGQAGGGDRGRRRLRVLPGAADPRVPAVGRGHAADRRHRGGHADHGRLRRRRDAGFGGHAPGPEVAEPDPVRRGDAAPLRRRRGRGGHLPGALPHRELRLLPDVVDLRRHMGRLGAGPLQARRGQRADRRNVAGRQGHQRRPDPDGLPLDAARLDEGAGDPRRQQQPEHPQERRLRRLRGLPAEGQGGLRAAGHTAAVSDPAERAPLRHLRVPRHVPLRKQLRQACAAGQGQDRGLAEAARLRPQLEQLRLPRAGHRGGARRLPRDGLPLLRRKHGDGAQGPARQASRDAHHDDGVHRLLPRQPVRHRQGSDKLWLEPRVGHEQPLPQQCPELGRRGHKVEHCAGRALRTGAPFGGLPVGQALGLGAQLGLVPERRQVQPGLLDCGAHGPPVRAPRRAAGRDHARGGGQQPPDRRLPGRRQRHHAHGCQQEPRQLDRSGDYPRRPGPEVQRACLGHGCFQVVC